MMLQLGFANPSLSLNNTKSSAVSTPSLPSPTALSSGMERRERREYESAEELGGSIATDRESQATKVKRK